MAADEALGPCADPVVELLWQAAGAAVSGWTQPDVAGAARAVAERQEGRRLAALAAAHRLSPLLWRLLQEAGATACLGPVEAEMASLAAALRAEALLTVPRLVALAVEPLRAAGLDAVVLKGPAVAARYPAEGLRPMDDLDLLVPPLLYRPALACLQDAGWQVVRRQGWERYDTVLRHRALPTMPLELHEGLQGFHERATTIDAEALWRRRRPAVLCGQQTWVPAAEDELLMLAAHAAKPFHVFLRLIWVVDLALVVGEAEQSGGLDWDLVWRRARRWRCATAVGVGLTLAGRLGDVVPAPALRTGWCEGSQWRRRALAEILAPSWPGQSGGTSRFHLRFALADTWWRRLVLLVGAPYQMTWGERVAWPAVAAFRALRRMRTLAAGDLGPGDRVRSGVGSGVPERSSGHEG